MRTGWRLLRWAGWGALTLFLVALFVSIALLFPWVQTWIARQVAQRLRDEAGIVLSIDRVAIRPFAPVGLHGVFLADLRGDTLLWADNLKVNGLRIELRGRSIRARSLALTDARFRLAKAEGDSTSNLTQLLGRIASPPSDAPAAPWSITSGEVKVAGLHFSYHDGNVPVMPHGVDFDHVDARRVSVVAHRLVILGDSIAAALEGVSLAEHSGLRLDQLAGHAVVSPRGLGINGLALRTPGTDLRGDLSFRTDGWEDYGAFADSVDLRLDLDSSRVQFSDIALFAPDLHGIDLPITASGRFRGTISDLRGSDMRVRFGRSSVFEGDAQLTGLPAIGTTFIVVDVEHLRTDPVDLGSLPVPPFDSPHTLSLPTEVGRLGAMSFTGNFTGFLDAFTAYGRATTGLGSVRTDMSYERDTTSGAFRFTGRVATDGFALGGLLDDPNVGPLACDVRMKAHGRTMKTMVADIEGTVPLLTMNQYRITNITTRSRIDRDHFNGELSCRDPSLVLDLSGMADRSGRWPRVDLTANIQHADLVALNLLDTTGYSTLSVIVKAQGELAPDSLKGTLLLDDISYCDERGEHDFGDIHLRSSRSGGEPLMELRSSMADLDVRGPFLPTRLPEALRSVVFSVFPSLKEQVTYAHEEQRFDLELELKDLDPVLAMFAPELDVAPGATASGYFDSRTFDLGLAAFFPHLAYGGASADSVSVIADKTMDVLAFSFRSEQQALNDSTYISDIDIIGKAYQDEVELSVGWGGSSLGTEGELRLQAQVNGPRSIEVDLLPSTLFFGRGSWSNPEPAHLAWDSTCIRVDSLALWNGDQRVLLDGHIGKDPHHALAFDLSGVRLENLAPFLGGPDLHGSLDGDGRLFDLLHEPYMISYLCLDSLAIRNEPVGDLRFAATWNESDDFVDLNGTLQRGVLKALDFTGRFAPGNEEELAVRLLFDRFDLAFVEPYLPEGISDIQGRVTGEVDITGRLGKPLINGAVDLENAGLRIDYLNTRYTFTHRVNILPDMFTLDLVRLQDEDGHFATAVGTIMHDGLADWNFDVALDMEHFMCLNTSPFDNELYYGQAYATGAMQVSGFADNIEINVDARTEPGTELHFPLGGSSEISDIDFVRFINTGQGIDSIERAVDLTGVLLDMDVEVTPEARFELIFDPTVGDILHGSGRGDIRMRVTPGGDFTMRGGLSVTEGDYLFTLRNVVNKRFQIDPGGTITWYGDPFNAVLDLNAVYRLRASLYDIMREKNEAYKKRVPVDVVMHLGQALMNPDIAFEVRMPTVDESVRAEVSSVLSTEQERNRQVFALIMFNHFLPPPGSSEAASTNVAGTTLAEFASNQLSNWADQINENLDLGVSYRPGDAVTQEEWEVMAGAQILNDRLLLSTNLGVQTGSSTSQQANTLVGDFQAEYLLTDEGKLRLKAFNRSNDENLNDADQAPYTQGVGVIYRAEFNSLWQWLTGREKRKKPVVEAPADGDAGSTR